MYRNESLIAVGSAALFIIIFGTILSLLNRKKTVVKTTIPEINVLIGITYLILEAYTILEATSDHGVACLIYLWFPFVMTITLTSCYIAKCWRLYVITTIARLSTIENYFPESEDFLITSERESIDETKANFRVPLKKRESGMGGWVYRHKWVGSLEFIGKVISFFIVLSLLVPLGLMFAYPKYQSTQLKCEDRTLAEMIIYLFFLIMAIVVFTVTFVKLRKTARQYGLKKQLLGSLLAWVIVAVGIIILYGLVIVFKSGTIAYLFSLFNCFLYVIPFYPDTLLPLWWSYRNKKMLRNNTPKRNIEGLIEEKDGSGKDVGWESLISFANENLSSADKTENQVLIHGMCFVRDYILRTKRILKARKIDKRIEELNADEATILNRDLCSFSMECWMMYIRQMGDYTWLKEDTDAPFLLDHTVYAAEEISYSDVKSRLGRELKSAIGLTESGDAGTMHLPGETLGIIYRGVVRKLESEIYKPFKKSLHFQYFVSTVSKKQIDF